jgi:hypothetical protein
MKVTATGAGPVFDGRAEKAAEDATDQIERSVSILGASMVRTELGRVLRHQTPYYRTRVEAMPEAPGWKVTDQGVIYGFWLEGIGSRNSPVTRFKGYHTFQRMTAVLAGRAKMIAESVLVRFVGRMN